MKTNKNNDLKKIFFILLTIKNKKKIFRSMVPFYL